MKRDRTKDGERVGNDAGAEDRMEQLLRDLRPAELPPYYRTRLLARLRESSRRAAWTSRLRTPGLAWGVAGACVVALVVVVLYATRMGPAPAPGGPAGQVASVQSNIEPVMPADNAVVGAGDVEIVAAIYPPIEGGIVRLYIDERDVTGLAEVTDSYVMYSPAEKLAEGEHIVTIEIRDGSGRRLRDISWLFHTLNGRTGDGAGAGAADPA